MAETTAWRSHCQFITFISFLFTVNVIRPWRHYVPRLIQINYDVHDVQDEENVISAKFGKDLFNISKVIGRKKWPSFFDSQCIRYMNRPGDADPCPANGFAVFRRPPSVVLDPSLNAYGHVPDTGGQPCANSFGLWQ